MIAKKKRERKEVKSLPLFAFLRVLRAFVVQNP